MSKVFVKLKKILPVIAAVGLFAAMGLTAFAGNLPRIVAKQSSVSVNNGNPSDTVSFTVDNWRSPSPFKVYLTVADPSVASAELDSQNGYDFKIRVKSKGSGNTVLKVWLDGFSRTCSYININSMVYNKKTVEGISIGDYGYMTGTQGECAFIDNYVVDKSSGSPILWIYFSLKDRGLGNGNTATFQINCEESDGDPLGIVRATGTGMIEGGTGYKLGFRLPANTASVKLENMDF